MAKRLFLTQIACDHSTMYASLAKSWGGKQMAPFAATEAQPVPSKAQWKVLRAAYSGRTKPSKRAKL